MSVIITGHVYRDELNYKPLPTPIGPFVNESEAAEWMRSLGPLWGSWGVEPLTDPQEAAHKTVWAVPGG